MDQEQLNAGLLEAAGRGNTKSVEDLVARGANVNCKDGDGQSPLHWAADQGHTETVSRLVELGGDINSKNKYGQSPLHLAAGYGHTKTVSRLVELGGDVNVKDDELGRSPLHWAALQGHTETVSRLVELGGDVNSKDNIGKTPYDLADNDNIRELLKIVQDNIKAGLPRELLQLGKQSASVFTDLLKEESYELFELRSMLQGEQGTGKSTIARFLVGKGPTKFRRSTDGIDLYTGLSFFDDDTEEWIGGKQVFKMEDITFSRSVRSVQQERTPVKPPEQANISDPKDISSTLPNEISRKILEKQELLHLSIDEELTTSADLSQPKEEVMIQQEGLKHQSKDEKLTTKADIPQPKEEAMIHQSIDEKLTSNKNKGRDKNSHGKPEDNTHVEIIKNKTTIGKLKACFGVKKEIKEVKISVTKESFYKKSRDVATKDFHKRKLVPVTIWDFGGQDVFYSTHQTFLTYRAVYMLILDGSRTLNEPCKYEQFLPGKTGVKTQKDYVRFWINTIITYCKGDYPGFPKIMVILTHKDALNVNEIESRRNELFGEIEAMFAGSPIEHHLVIEDRIFVNAKNNEDPEMERIKQALIQQARNQPTWGQKLPKCFLPLELEMQNLVKNGVALIHIDHMKKINSQQPVRPLTVSELNLFLKFQHSVGKILYFDEPFLDQHIIISPKYLIDAFKSIITDRQFCKGDKKKKEAWHSMEKKGIILKQTVEVIWKQKKYEHFLKCMGYLLGVMTHLDILVEPRRYDSAHKRKPTNFYYVASMIRKQDTTRYLLSPRFHERNIALCFDTSGSIIPPALSFRFISYCLSIWGVKTYGDDNEEMLFHRSAVFTIDPSLDMHIQCEEDQLIVRLVHARNRSLIMKDLASSIRECLFAALHKISQLYIKTSSEGKDNIQSFDVKVCCSSSKEPCSVALKDIGDVWICSRHQIEHGKDLVSSWFTEKGKEMCDSFCSVMDEQFLLQTPTDFHLRRLALEYDTKEISELVMQLKFPFRAWKKLDDSGSKAETIGFEALQKCFQMTPFTFKDLKTAAEKQGIQNPHTICKVLRDQHISFDNEPEKWDLTATDEDIDKLAPTVGDNSLAFLVELGLTFQDWEQIEYSERDLAKLNRKIMDAWRTNCKVHNIRPTLRAIGQAFGNIGKNIKIIENILFI